MDRMLKATFHQKTVYFCYTISVLFDAVEKFGTVQLALDMLQSDGKDAYDAVQWFAARLSQEGAVCRREMGYECPEILTEAEVSLRMPPVEFSLLREAVVEAVSLGYRREIPDGENQERDLGLEELNEKKEKAGESGQSTTTRR